MNQAKIRLFLSVVLITVICGIGYAYMYETSWKPVLDKKPLLKHSLNFIWLLAVFASGYYGWNGFKKKWVKDLWVIAYLSIIIILTISGIIDLLVGGFKLNIKEMFGYLRFFFQSPMPFVLLLILASQSKDPS